MLPRSLYIIPAGSTPVGELLAVARDPQSRIALGEDARAAIEKAHRFLQQKFQNETEPIYGINTGFGYLCDTSIPPGQLEDLQANLVRSHACGAGDPVPEHLVRLMLLLKIKSLSYGHSGISIATVDRLIDFFNNGLCPRVWQQGSLGASGDLAPLAHLSLPLIGEGSFSRNGGEVSAAQIHAEMGWEPLKLQAKEGLALLNGTQFMLAYALDILGDARQFLDHADTLAALSLDAFDGRRGPFFPHLHRIRPHSGQIHTAERILSLIEGSEIAAQAKKQVQDPYSFRCVPQVHGASRDALNYAASVFQTEADSVSDNPNIFPDDDIILSGGNFHGQPLALALDFLCLALAEIGSISERRVFQLLSGTRELPPFLVKSPGLQSGLMIAQYTAASIVSQNKQLCSPASVDTIPSSNGQEDHVSMGANGATKAWKVMHNLKTLLSIELLTAAQAIDFRRPLKSSPELEKLLAAYREVVPFIETDRVLATDFQKGREFLARLQP